MKATLNEELKTPEIIIDTTIELDDLNPKFYRILKQFSPFGPQNTAPIFVTESVVDTGHSRCVGKDEQHLKITVKKGESKSINAIGFGLGGNQVKSGMIDVSPDTLDFLFNYFTGGAGMFIQRSLTFGYDLTTGNVFDAFEDGLTGQSVRDQIRKTPLLRKAITSVSEREDTGKFIQKRNVIFGAKKELKNAIETRDMSEIRRVREKYRDELRIYGIIRAINTAPTNGFSCVLLV